MLRSFCAIFAALTVLCVAATAGHGAERIVSFESTIRVELGGVIEVTERITVEAEGTNIKRGIYRDFPTVRGRQWWGPLRTSFDIMTVSRGGSIEPWFIEAIPDGVRLYIGARDQLLPRGLHTYTITYRTDRQIGFFTDHDELYWNVTGNFWNFPIERVTGTMTLPTGAAATTLDVFTGAVGSTDKSATIAGVGRDVVNFATSRPFAPGEGLTIAIAWPKNFVRVPTIGQSALFFFRDLGLLGPGLVGLVALVLYYLIAWLNYGRDPESGTVVPHYDPPQGMTPAGCRYVLDRGWSPMTFGATLVDMAVKGYLVLDDAGQDAYVATRTGKSEAACRLTVSERTVASLLFATDRSVAFRPINRAKIIAARDALKAWLQDEFESIYFLLNRGTLIPGLALTVITLIAMVAMSPSPLKHGSTGGFLLAVMLPLGRAGYRITRALTEGGGKYWAGAIAAVALAAIVFDPRVAKFFDFAVLRHDSVLQIMLLFVAILATINIAFHHLMEAPTRLGRKVMDQIEGFRHYLMVAEKDRLAFHNPPELTPEVFEKNLPYAMALGVESEWGEQFSAAIARTAEFTGQSVETSYQPRWYRGRSWSFDTPESLGSDVAKSLANSVATSVAPLCPRAAAASDAAVSLGADSRAAAAEAGVVAAGDWIGIFAGLAACAVIHRLWLARRLAEITAMRSTADEALWRRYNVVGDMAAWAANNGTAETQALFDRVLAARGDVISQRGDARARLAAEDAFQTALNAFYAAAYRDDDLLGVHEWVVTAARALKADESAETAVRAHDTAARAFSARHAPWLFALYRLSAPSPFGLAVSYRHPSAAELPLA